MNAELQRQHAEAKARRTRLNRGGVACRAISQLIVRECVDYVPPPRPSQHDAHVWARAASWTNALPKRILGAVQSVTGFSLDELRCERRTASFVVPRHLAMYLLVEDGHLTMPEVGRRLNRDHTSVLHGHRKITGRLKDRATRGQIAAIRAIYTQAETRP